MHIEINWKERLKMDQNIIVNERCANIRTLGRDALKGRWGLAVLGTLLYMLLVMIPVFILNYIFNSGDGTPSGISSIYSLLISGPMTLGYAMFSISILRKRETSAAEVFYGFERFGKAFGLYIVMTIFVFLWTLLLIVPGIIAAFRYSMSFYILADNPNIGIMEALNESKRLMRGNKWKFFCLNLSFIGWGILACLSVGIGFLWLMPYMEVSFIAFYDLANGSLRPVRSLGEYAGFNGNSTSAMIDPITVYKETETAGPAENVPEITSSEGIVNEEPSTENEGTPIDESFSESSGAGSDPENVKNE